MTDVTLTRIVNIIRQIEPGDDVYGQLVKDVTDAADALNQNNAAAFAKATYNLNDKTNRMAAAFNIGNVNENVDLGGYAVQLGQANVGDVIKAAFQPENGGLEAVSQRWAKIDLNAQKMRAKAASGEPQAVEQKNIFDQMMEDDQAADAVTQIAGGDNGDNNPATRPTRANSAPTVMAARPDEPPPRDPHYNVPNDPDPVPVRGGANPDGGGDGGGPEGGGGGGAGGGGGGGGAGGGAAAAGGGRAAGGIAGGALLGDAALLGMITGVGGEVAKNMEVNITNPYVRSGTDLAKQTGGRLWNSMMGGLDLTGDLMSGNIAGLPAKIENMVKESPAGWAIGRLFGWNTEKQMGENQTAGSTIGGSIGMSSSSGPTGDILNGGGNKPPELPYSSNGFLPFDPGDNFFNSSSNNLDGGVRVSNRARGYAPLGETGFMRDETISQNLQAFSYMDPLYEINALINMKRGGGAGTIIGQANAAAGHSSGPIPGATGSGEFYANAMRYMGDYFSLRANAIFSRPMRVGFTGATILSAAALADPNILGGVPDALAAYGYRALMGGRAVGRNARLVAQAFGEGAHLARRIGARELGNAGRNIRARARAGVDDYQARIQAYRGQRAARRIERQYQRDRYGDLNVGPQVYQAARRAAAGAYATIRNRLIQRPRRNLENIEEGYEMVDMEAPPVDNAAPPAYAEVDNPAAPVYAQVDADGGMQDDEPTVVPPPTVTQTTGTSNVAPATEATLVDVNTPQPNTPQPNRDLENAGVNMDVQLSPPQTQTQTQSIAVGQTPPPTSEEAAVRTLETLATASNVLADVAEGSMQVSNTTSGAPPTTQADLAETNIINATTPGITTRSGSRIPPPSQSSKAVQTPNYATPSKRPTPKPRSSRLLDFSPDVSPGTLKQNADLRRNVSSRRESRRAQPTPMSTSERRKYWRKINAQAARVSSHRTTTNTNPPKKEKKS